MPTSSPSAAANLIMEEIDARLTNAGTTARMEAHAHLPLQVRYENVAYFAIFIMPDIAVNSWVKMLLYRLPSWFCWPSKILHTFLHFPPILPFISLHVSVLPQALLPVVAWQALQDQIVTCTLVRITAGIKAIVRSALETSQLVTARLASLATSASTVSVCVVCVTRQVSNC